MFADGQEVIRFFPLCFLSDDDLSQVNMDALECSFHSLGRNPQGIHLSHEKKTLVGWVI